MSKYPPRQGVFNEEAFRRAAAEYHRAHEAGEFNDDPEPDLPELPPIPTAEGEVVVQVYGRPSRRGRPKTKA